MKYVDLTQMIDNDTKVYPGDESFSIKQAATFKNDGYTAYNISTGLHVGTHIDIPMHMYENEKYISEYPLDRFIGNGVLINVVGEEIISLKEEYYNNIKENDIVLFYTGYSNKFGEDSYFENHPVLSEELAEFLVIKKIKMLGIDAPSPDKYPYNIHKILLKNDIALLENITNLKDLLYVEKFEVFAQPLKINAEASLVRAFAQYKGY
ncbi:MAG: cyclase family protein [Clostridium sp.]|nr:cyclase family protein [Clostridium sp.]